MTPVLSPTDTPELFWSESVGSFSTYLENHNTFRFFVIAIQLKVVLKEIWQQLIALIDFRGLILTILIVTLSTQSRVIQVKENYKKGKIFVNKIKITAMLTEK